MANSLKILLSKLQNFYDEISFLHDKSSAACSPSDIWIDSSLAFDLVSKSSALLYLDHSIRYERLCGQVCVENINNKL